MIETHVSDEISRVVTDIMRMYTDELEIACQLALTETPRTYWHTLHLTSYATEPQRFAACHWPAIAATSDKSPWA